MAKNELHIFQIFLLASFGRKWNYKSLNKFDPWVSMVRLSRWLCQGNVFVLIFDLVQHVAPFFCSGHWHNYFLQLGQAVQASVQSIFLRCLCFPLDVLVDPRFYLIYWLTRVFGLTMRCILKRAVICIPAGSYFLTISSDEKVRDPKRVLLVKMQRYFETRSSYNATLFVFVSPFKDVSSVNPKLKVHLHWRF